jgi:hypothetical protein
MFTNDAAFAGRIGQGPSVMKERLGDDRQINSGAGSLLLRAIRPTRMGEDTSIIWEESLKSDLRKMAIVPTRFQK